jgi:hypothetical protein
MTTTQRRLKVNRPFVVLLAATTTLLAAQPFLMGAWWQGAILNLLFSGVMIAGLVIAAEDRRTVGTGLVLGVPAVLLRWAVYVYPGEVAVLLSLASSTVFLVFTVVAVLLAVLREREVSIDTISGGLCVYLLLGLTWALLYAALEVMVPGALVGGELTLASNEAGSLPVPGGFDRLLYLSFVTLSTLGYGDIVPVTPVARLLTAGEAVVGQIFLAVFVARLVGLYIAREQNR